MDGWIDVDNHNANQCKYASASRTYAVLLALE